MQETLLIPYSCGAGAQNKSCADGPEYLKKNGFAQLLKARGVNIKWHKDSLPPHMDEESDIATVAKYCRNLKDQVQNVLQADGFPITIGGDHSMAIGTWTGVADSLYTRRKLGLIWIDAHMDAHTADTSPTSNRHGMPISYLLGYGKDELSKITKGEPVIVPHQLCLIGVRSFEPEESALLQDSGVRVFTIEEIRRRGLETIMLEAVKIVSTHTAGFGLSIDIDAFDPKIAPGTGTTQKNGLFKEEFIVAMHNTLKGYKDRLLALEIAEYNPHLDKNKVTLDLIADITASILKSIK